MLQPELGEGFDFRQIVSRYERDGELVLQIEAQEARTEALPANLHIEGDGDEGVLRVSFKAVFQSNADLIVQTEAVLRGFTLELLTQILADTQGDVRGIDRFAGHPCLLLQGGPPRKPWHHRCRHRTKTSGHVKRY